MAAEIEAVRITAGGYGTRIRELMDAEGYAPNFPKHLLPTGGPGGETLLGRIIRQAETVPAEMAPIVFLNPENEQTVRNHPDIPPVNFSTQKFNYSLDPFYYALATTERRVVGCAGDYYSDFKWSDMIARHEASGFPISVLAGHSAAVEVAAVYDVREDGSVASFSRPEKSTAEDLINIGAYVFDPTVDVLRALYAVLPKDPTDLMLGDDAIISSFIQSGLVGAIAMEGTHFNINTPNAYEALRQTVSSSVS